MEVKLKDLISQYAHGVIATGLSLASAGKRIYWFMDLKTRVLASGSSWILVVR